MITSSVKGLKPLTFFLLGLMISTMLTSCVEVLNPYTQLPPGIWRGILDINDEVDIPFNFTISYRDGDRLVMTIHNDTERIELTDLSFGRNKNLDDTLIVNFALLDSHIKAEYKENVLEGFWIRRNRPNYRIPFVAYHGQSHRFSTDNERPQGDVSGRWRARFEIETPTEYPAVGEFVQNGNRLTGTFMTETGDYRYLEGQIQGSQLALSCFDGGHAFLFTGELTGDDEIIGKFYSGNHYETNWLAVRDSTADLSDPYGLTKALRPSEAINFELPDSDGKLLSLNDPKFEGRPKLITIMGTWCPNCLDESRFILDYLDKNPDLDVAVIAVAFEKYRNADKALDMLKTYKDRLGIPYDIVLGGYYDKAEATATFGYLDKISSYPTLLFLDRQNRISRIHTGFTGPATSKFPDFVREFEDEIQYISQKSER